MLRLPDDATALLAYWREKQVEGGLPHRHAISPSRLRRWVGDMSVVHLHEGEKRFYVALHGTNVGRHLGPDFNRRYLEDAVPKATLHFSLAPYLACLDEPVPVYSIMTPSFENGLHSRLDRLVMPFCDDDPSAIERYLVWVAPNDRAPDQPDSIYDSVNEGECSEGMLRMFRLYESGPEEIGVSPSRRRSLLRV